MAQEYIKNGNVLDLFELVLEDKKFDTRQEFLEKVASIADDIEEELGRCQRMIENDPDKFADDFDCEIQEIIDEEKAEEEAEEAEYQAMFGDDAEKEEGR